MLPRFKPESIHGEPERKAKPLGDVGELSTINGSSVMVFVISPELVSPIAGSLPKG